MTTQEINQWLAEGTHGAGFAILAGNELILRKIPDNYPVVELRGGTHPTRPNVT